MGNEGILTSNHPKISKCRSCKTFLSTG